MGLSVGIRAVRDWVVGRVLVAWPDVTVTSEPVPGDVGVGLATVAITEVAFVPGTLLQDEADVRFSVGCRFAVGAGSVDDLRVDRASDLRDAMSPVCDIAGYGHLGTVSGLTVRDLDPSDKEIGVRVEFVCRVVAARG